MTKRMSTEALIMDLVMKMEMKTADTFLGKQVNNTLVMEPAYMVPAVGLTLDMREGTFEVPYWPLKMESLVMNHCRRHAPGSRPTSVMDW